MDGLRTNKQDWIRRLKNIAAGVKFQTSARVFCIVVAVLVLATPLCAQVTIGTSSLPGTTVNSTYSQMVSASGGTQPYTWSISAGALPDGLSLNTSSGAITGTPTTAGTPSFTVQVVDGAMASDSK